MKIIIKTKNLELTPSLENYINEKIGSLEKFIKNLQKEEEGKTLSEMPHLQTGRIGAGVMRLFLCALGFHKYGPWKKSVLKNFTLRQCSACLHWEVSYVRRSNQRKAHSPNRSR